MTMLKSLVAVALILLVAAPARSQSSEELKQQQAEIQKEINDLKVVLRDTKKNKKATLGQLALVQRRLRLRQRAINNINVQIRMIQGDIGQSRNEISRLKVELDTLKAQYEKSVVYAYKNRSNYEFLNFIFSATSFNDALKRLEYIKSYRAYREQQAANILATQDLLKQKISSLEFSRKRHDEVLQKQEKQKKVLVQERREKDDVVRKLGKREKELSKELAEKARADRKLKAGIAAAIKREMAKEAEAARRREASGRGTNANPSGSNATAGSSTSSRSTSVFEATPEGKIISENFEKNKGKLPWPVDKGIIKIHYGPYSIPNTKLHNTNPGLTLETNNGANVKAVFNGQVITVFDVDGTYAVVLKHGRYFTSYGNLATVNVKKGENVRSGQMIGKAAPNDDGNGEVEFLLLQDTRNIDPEPWIQRR